MSALYRPWTEQHPIHIREIWDWWKQHPKKPRHLYRVSVGRVLAARIGPIDDFADYHERFRHDNELTAVWRENLGATLSGQMKSLQQE